MEREEMCSIGFEPLLFNYDRNAFFPLFFGNATRRISWALFGPTRQRLLLAANYSWSVLLPGVTHFLVILAAVGVRVWYCGVGASQPCRSPDL